MLSNIYNRFLRSENTIQYHLRKEYQMSLLFSFIVRFLHVFSFLLIMIVGEPMHVTYSIIMYLHSLNLIYLGGLNLYIMFFHNTPTTEIIIQGIKSAGYFACGSFMAHNALSVYIIPPNTVSNTYHIYSPTGRGYGAYSCSQLIAVDALKGAQGHNFNVGSVVNEHKMLDSSLIAKEFAKTSDLPSLKAYLSGKAK